MINANKHIDNEFASANYQFIGGDRGVLQFETDYNYLGGDTDRLDAYFVAEAVPHPRLAFDVLAGVTSARGNDERSTDASLGFVPSWQVNDNLKAAFLYAFSNDIDTEDYFELGLTPKIAGINGSLTLVIANTIRTLCDFRPR